MSQKSKNIYQFKITLEGSSPPIWRRIQVPESDTFWDLHVTIQDAMGWEDDQLHQFIFLHSPSGKRLNRDERFFIGVPFEEGLEERGKTLPCWKENISSHLSLKSPVVIYEYDFGDMWIHVVKLEKILPLNESIKYPLCVDGKRACPPEDCGGVGGMKLF